jgi:hypothetical protein
VFLDSREKFSDMFGPPEPFSLALEPGVYWRTATDDDRASLADWHEFFREFHSQSESESMTTADSVLSPDRPSVLEEMGGVPAVIDAFMIALTLHTSAPLAAQLSRFEIEETPQEKLIPNSGNRAVQTVRLPGWAEAQPITRATIGAVVTTYSDAKRVRDQPIDNGMTRSLGAYRAATSAHVFIDAIPILACASLEALTTTYKAEKVMARIVPRYVPEEARKPLEAFYRLRQWFAHGADIPEMREQEVRFRTLSEGLLAVKSVLRAAIADPDLFTAAGAGVKAVREFLDS